MVKGKYHLLDVYASLIKECWCLSQSYSPPPQRYCQRTPSLRPMANGNNHAYIDGVMTTGAIHHYCS